MSERNFSRRRRGMHFRPSGGLHGNVKRQERAALEARAQATGEKATSEHVYDAPRQHAREIERAENIAAGLPPEGQAVDTTGEPAIAKKAFREPHLDTPAEVKEYTPVDFKEAPPQGFVETIKVATTKIIRKVQRMIRPVKKIHKEVIINAENLETRVAVLEEGKLEEFNIERTS